MMRQVRFSEDWISPLDQRRSFALIASALADSTGSQIWPREYSESRLEGAGHTPAGAPLGRGSLLEVTYKLGPIHRKVVYRVVEVIEPRYIQYETTDLHPLAGGGRIYFRALYGGKSLCKWEGGYRVRDRIGYAALAWFKAYYERQFFRAIKERFEALTPEAGGESRSA